MKWNKKSMRCISVVYLLLTPTSMNIFTCKDTQITKYIGTWELPWHTHNHFVSVPMCIHNITIIPNMHDNMHDMRYKYIGTWELPWHTHNHFVSVPMCIHNITIIPNMHDMRCLFVLLICRHALLKSCCKIFYLKVYHTENIIDVLFISWYDFVTKLSCRLNIAYL